MTISIREEEPGDISAIQAINERAFGQREEVDIVDRLRESCDELLSLVAECDGEVVGHILFSPVVTESERGAVRGMGLAPMAVLPEYQRKGIGTALAERGLEILRERSCPYVIVVGHPGYYPRFGFISASQRGIECQWPGVPDGAFMILVLDESAMEGVAGVARYRDEFDAAM